MKQELIFNYFIEQMISNVPLYFLAFGMLFFILNIKKKSSINKPVITALIISCLYLSLAVAGRSSVEYYLTYLKSEALASGYLNISSYIKSLNIDISNELTFQRFYVSQGYVFKILMLIFSYFFIEKEIKLRKKMIILIPGVICILLFACSPWTGWCYYFDNLNFEFHKTALYSYIYFVMFFYALHVFVEIIKNYKNDKKIVGYLYFLFGGTFAIAFIQSGDLLKSRFDIVDYVFMAAIFIYYLLIESYVVFEEITIKDKDLYDSKVSIMTSQVRPHFIFNCITNIIELCEDESEAKAALLAFSRYLRVNINSFNKSDAVLFGSELDYIKNYVSLEKMRFSDKFEINYDIKTSSFYVPIISIEIYVENAIKHNVGQRDGIIHIELKTYEDEDNYIVEINDDGVGFDTAKLNSSNYVGANNAKYRLENIVKAKVLINSVVDKGTRVYVMIPKTTGGIQ